MLYILICIILSFLNILSLIRILIFFLLFFQYFTLISHFLLLLFILTKKYKLKGEFYSIFILWILTDNCNKKQNIKNFYISTSKIKYLKKINQSQILFLLFIIFININFSKLCTSNNPLLNF